MSIRSAEQALGLLPILTCIVGDPWLTMLCISHQRNFKHNQLWVSDNDDLVFCIYLHEGLLSIFICSSAYIDLVLCLYSSGPLPILTWSSAYIYPVLCLYLPGSLPIFTWFSTYIYLVLCVCCGFPVTSAYTILFIEFNVQHFFCYTLQTRISSSKNKTTPDCKGPYNALATISFPCTTWLFCH
jgi:hypothetical protein